MKTELENVLPQDIEKEVLRSLQKSWERSV